MWKERNRAAKNSVCPIVTQDNAQGCGVMYRDCDCIGSMLRHREGPQFEHVGSGEGVYHGVKDEG